MKLIFLRVPRILWEELDDRLTRMKHYPFTGRFFHGTQLVYIMMKSRVWARKLKRRYAAMELTQEQFVAEINANPAMRGLQTQNLMAMTHKSRRVRI